MTSGNLRERLKNETRSAIVAAALDLFERNGYDQTTVEDIASAAGIATRTFFRYFESKAAVVLDPGPENEHSGDELVEAILLRPASESPSQAMAAVLRSGWASIFDDDGTTLRQLRVAVSDTSLTRLAQSSFHDLRPDLTRAFAARLDRSTDDLAPRVLAAAFTEAGWVILEHWIAAGGRKQQLPGMIDEAFASLNNELQ